MNEPFTVVIPSRYGSTRLPGKPLANIAGRPMIAWVYERATMSGAAEVMVATDDERIAVACGAFGARVEMTRTDHASGTDRIAELAVRLGWDDNRIVVNLQGDEPRIPPCLIAQAAKLLASRRDAAIATLVTPIESDTDLNDPNAVKVVTDRHDNALYFSRAAIPFGATRGVRRHIGIYAYRVASLKRVTAEPPCVLERTERLEQLRALWLGERIVVADALETPPRGVDTLHDLEAVRAAAGHESTD